MASVIQRPESRFWSACFTSRDGRQLKRSTKTTDREAALRMAMEWERLEQEDARPAPRLPPTIPVLSGTQVQQPTGTPAAISVETFLDEWLATVKVRNAAGTLERYGVTVGRFKKSIGPLAQGPLAAITPRHIEKFLTERLAAGLAPKTAIIEVKILKTAFGRAEVHDLIVKNPVRGLILPKSTPSRREVFTHAEVQMLMDAAPNVEWQTVILLGYYLGARLTDCANMTWDNIRPTDGLIVYEQKKTGKEVIVPMHYHVIEHLTHVAEFGTEGPLCPGLASKKPGGKSGLSEAFKRIMKRAGIDALTVQGKGVRKFSKRSFHSLRHSFNSALANAGVGQELRMKLTGHSSTVMNDQYTHFNVQALKDAVTALPLFDGSAGQSKD